MTAYELLSPAIRKYVRDKGWESFRPIQEAAIRRIMSNDNHYILASRTASGKTEAAFLPILSKVNFNDSGVKVLYLSPLIALINDQFMRVEDLCKDMEIVVTKWHGEANRSLKEKLVKDPQGIVLMTPESLEAMFVNKPYNVKQLFSRLNYVVIDEIHSFIGSDRGVQLKSLLSRLQDINESAFSVVGLSATLGDFAEAKKFTGDPEKTVVLRDNATKELDAEFRYFKETPVLLPLDFLKDLYKETRDHKVLIFPNSRGKAEEIAVSLLKISERVGGHANYFSHHSSVDKQVREYVEEFAKSKIRRNFTIACTSTLELGIDIGSVDQVVQVEAAHSIASLIQRVGRSGRTEGVKSSLLLYATEPWSLLQSLASWLLYLEGFIEPPQINDFPYDILVHQTLSITKGHSGIAKTELARQLKHNYSFSAIPAQEIDEIIEHLIQNDLLEQLRHEVIIGVSGEKVVNSREFYSVFQTTEYYKVTNAGNGIGQIPFSPVVVEDENILLAARIWKIKYIDHDSKKIEVIPAHDGKKPLFFGGSGDVHPRIREKMLAILYSKEVYPVLNEASALEIDQFRKDFAVYALQDVLTERPFKIGLNECILYSFNGTRINRTLNYLWKLKGIGSGYEEDSSSFKFALNQGQLEHLAKLIDLSDDEIDFHLENLIDEVPGIMNFSKWGSYLPVNYQIKLLKDKYFDFAGVKQFQTLTMVPNASSTTSPILSNSFVAIDFETANEKRNSICQVAIAIVENNEVVFAKDWLVRPQELRFSPFNTFVHGLNVDAVKHAPEFPEVWKELLPLLQGKTLIAHNASFDMYVLRDVLQLYSLAVPGFSFWCTMFAAKQHLKMTKYSLPNVCLYYGIVLNNHHHAKSDAIACAEIAIRLGTPVGLREFPMEDEGAKDYIPFKIKKADLSGIEIYDLSEDVSGQTFFGKNVVVTGTFNNITRNEVEEYVIRMGAKLSPTINGKTSLLVMGENAGPSKIEKIKELNKTGFIPVIDEREFLEVVEALCINSNCMHKYGK